MINMNLKHTLFVILLLIMNVHLLFAQRHADEIKSLMQQANLPAISFAYIKDGKIAEHYSFGVTSAESGVLINDSTIPWVRLPLPMRSIS